MILAYSSYSKLVYDVTTVHMSLRSESFGGKLATGMTEKGNIHNLAESSDITSCMWIQCLWAMLTTPEPVGVTIAKMHKWSWSLINRCIIIYRG